MTEEMSLLRGFFNPAARIPLKEWTGRPEGTGVYFKDFVLRDPADLSGLIIEPEPGVALLPFNPERTIAGLVREEYAQGGSGILSRVPFRARWIPGRIKEHLLRPLLGARLARTGVFPRWPIEPCVEDIRALVADAAKRAGTFPEPAPFWPEGKRYAAMLSHDMDSGKACRKGYWKAFAEMEEAHGLRSSWHFCTEHFRDATAVMEELSRRGHEIAWHGHRHDPSVLRSSGNSFSESIRANRDFFKEYGVRGFRSPNFIRTPGLYRALKGILGYDSSARDTAAEIFSSRTREGCCTVFPFMRNGVLEIPVTVPDDISVRCVTQDDEESIFNVQLQKIEWIRSRGGVAVTLTHPESWISLRKPLFNAYRRLVEFVSRDRCAWNVLGRDIEAWWRKRAGGCSADSFNGEKPHRNRK